VSSPAFNHVSVTCSDFDRSMSFYHELLGLPIIEQGEFASDIHDELIGMTDVRLRLAELGFAEGGFLELIEYLRPQGEPVSSRTCDPGNVHLCLTVPDVDAVFERLDAENVVIRSPAPVRLRGGEWEGSGAFYCLDPDGVTVEIIGPLGAA
jgi:catechol 2,3-dioxygenase-like lactoylglutathione lyase family enzyme